MNNEVDNEISWVHIPEGPTLRRGGMYSPVFRHFWQTVEFVARAAFVDLPWGAYLDIVLCRL